MPLSMTLMSAVPDTTCGRTYYLEITWTDSVDPNAASNNIYRSTVSGGPYTLIANVPDGIQVFDDYTVIPEVTYYYVLTEVNNVGTESAFSAEQSGTPGWR